MTSVRWPALFWAILSSLFLVSLFAASAAVADVGPYASVYNSAGEVVAKWGAAYGSQPGGQIQIAENYAECGSTEPCPDPLPSKPLYPKVALDAGTFPILAPFGKVQPVWPKCEGIFAYSEVILHGAGSSGAGSVIQNDVEPSNPCKISGWGQLSAVLYMGADAKNINTSGTALNVSDVLIQGGYNVEYGLLVGPDTGSALSINDVTVTKPNQSGLQIGTESLPVSGSSSSSPAKVTNSAVEYSHNEGIVIEGHYVNVEHNTVTETAAHGIATFGPDSTYINVAHNTVNSSSWGLSFDGSQSASSVGEHNSAYNNTILNTCVGTVLYKQIDDYVAGNYYEDPYTGWKPKGYAQGCPEFQPTGIAISNSYNNFAWTNDIFNFEIGVWIFDGGASPKGVGTHWNYVGRVPDYGQPWPWPVQGNWIERPVLGLVASSSGNPAAVSENEFVGNAVDNFSRGEVYFEPGTKEIFSK